MRFILPIWLMFLISGLGIAIPVFVWSARRARNYDSHLWPLVEAAGFEFVRAESPKLFDVGPFPSIEITVGGWQTNIAGISGEYTVYRIVTIRDSQGCEHQAWSKLTFEAFRLRNIEWRPELSSIERSNSANREIN